MLEDTNLCSSYLILETYFDVSGLAHNSPLSKQEIFWKLQSQKQIIKPLSYVVYVYVSEWNECVMLTPISLPHISG